jgi:2-polyprenyl-3-methyl-5-hydroxy-6-metoxy-1,4-benzoquinol methylase
MSACFDTTVRNLQPERMDSPDLDSREHEAALRGLARINAVSRTADSLWPHLARAMRARPDQPFRLLDIACGAGDVAISLFRHNQRAQLPLQIHACDVSDLAIDFARRRARDKRADVHFFTLNALTDPIPQYHAITCNLFLHHLRDDQVIHLLRKLSQAAPLLLISDLRRHSLGLLAAYLATRILSTSPIVHIDGPRSVRAAFSLPELRALSHRAGLSNARIEKHFPFRQLLLWRRP